MNELELVINEVKKGSLEKMNILKKYWLVF